MGGQRLVEIIEALSLHPQLEQVNFWRINIERSECIQLAALVHHTSEIHTLALCNTGIDDEGVDVLLGAITNSGLSVLDLSSNQITARGCQSLAALLENPNCNLEKLFFYQNNIGDEGAHFFANAMTSNRKLTILNLYDNGITTMGWSGFSKVLCDTSSVNNTYLSNHTLESLGVMTGNECGALLTLLALNRSSENKKHVALRKILKHHQHFDMKPFFEWELKVLPTAVSWFERARSLEDIYGRAIDKQKLSVIYQFIRAMPEVFEPAPAAVGQMGE